MKLAVQEAELFYKLMWSLQHFVNQRLEVVTGVARLEEYQALPYGEKLKVRNALYEHSEIIDEYVRENPQGCSDDELEVVREWKKFARGDFFIERLLKRYAVFIGGGKVYGVLALQEAFEEIVPYVPFYVRAVLLPFRGRIVYDGLLEGYSVYLGGSIKRDLKETYMAAKQQGRIIVSFDPQEQTKRLEGKKKDWTPLLDEMLQGAKKLRSSSGEPAINSPAFGLVRASIEFARMATENPDDTERLWKAYRRVERVARRIETVLQRAEYFETEKT